MQTSEITGDLPMIIGNEEKLYEGNLIHYLQTLFYYGTNLQNPYHNFRHSLHVLWLCHGACRYYQQQLTPRQMRNLLIAALFHDFDHPGHSHPGAQDPDQINIEIALANLALPSHMNSSFDFLTFSSGSTRLSWSMQIG